MPTSEFTAPVREQPDKPSPVSAREGRDWGRWVWLTVTLAWLVAMALGFALLMYGLTRGEAPEVYEYSSSLVQRGITILVLAGTPAAVWLWLQTDD